MDILKRGGIIIQNVYLVRLVPGCLLVRFVTSGLRRFGVLQTKEKIYHEEEAGKETESCPIRRV